MTDELQAVSVGLRVDLTKLDADLAASQRKIVPIKGPHKVRFIVDPPNLGAIKQQIRTLLQARVRHHPVGRGLRGFGHGVST
jgi:hypothetical protein